MVIGFVINGATGGWLPNNVNSLMVPFMAHKLFFSDKESLALLKLMLLKWKLLRGREKPKALLIGISMARSCPVMLCRAQLVNWLWHSYVI